METDTPPETADARALAPPRWRTRVNQTYAFTARSLREVAGSVTLLFWVLGFPPVMYLLYATQNSDAPATLAATTSVGIAVFGAIFVCLYLFGNQLVIDVEARRYAAYRTMGISAAADLSGRLLAGLVLGAVAFAATVATGVATGASYGLRGPESVPIVVLAGVLTCLFWMIVAIPLVLATSNERVAEWTTTLVAVGAFALTGFNGVLPELSPLEGEVLNLLPNTLPTRLLVYHLVPAESWADLGTAPPVMPAGPEYVALLVSYTVVALAVGVVLVNRSLYGRGWWP
ncbi:ABC transporter permease [Natronobiforma cellulositropha]|uniref:ABC transporter permease n=1 Tax=Natronobiforma cellulositropha TaxID=1679076 RepID=UPI0021D610D4|nr:ABC transporter permease [Natronobiforma cellulositropha]